MNKNRQNRGTSLSNGQFDTGISLKSKPPIFVVSSGRSGTAMLAKALGIEHEYMVHITQPLAVKRYLGLVSSQFALETLSRTHGAAIHYAEGLWGDSSNKISWLIRELDALFPTAKFIHLVRDGRKVSSSYFHKLGRECYDDRSVEIMERYLTLKHDEPPPEKRYWWPLPPGKMSQFERIAWHWAEINRVILRDLEILSSDRRLFVRLEELTRPETVESLSAFAGVPLAVDEFSRPFNINRRQDEPLADAQRAQFDSLASEMMERLGYADRPEYRVNYG